MGAYGSLSRGSVIVALRLQSRQFAVHVDLDPEHDRAAADIAVLDIFLTAARDIDFGLERLAAVRALHALLIIHRASLSVFARPPDRSRAPACFGPGEGLCWMRTKGEHNWAGRTNERVALIVI